MTDVDSFSYLWDGSEAGWVLIRLMPDQLPAIYNRHTRAALTIEDDALCARLVAKMIEQGVSVLSDFPSPLDED
jgi:hypothetical protein